jgi:hypothetical protein
MTSNRRSLHLAFNRLMDGRFAGLRCLKTDAGALNHMEKIVTRGPALSGSTCEVLPD